jgi:NAD(P)-dependent dehydrogenase (short-subunit alcohol dehydrogenase family)
VVTGASKGIGGGIATALGAAGARVAVNYSSDREGAERVAQAITDNGGEAITVGADVSKDADVARLFRGVSAQLDARGLGDGHLYSAGRQVSAQTFVEKTVLFPTELSRVVVSPYLEHVGAVVCIFQYNREGMSVI